MKAVLPNDATFEDSFASATVSKSGLAKYYLRILEQQKSPDGTGGLVINPDAEKVNLEHILPQTYSAVWNCIPADRHSGLVKRLGNLALLNKRMNSKAANADFDTKKPYFEASKIILTNEVAVRTQWTALEIEERQRELAQLAVKAWPNKPPA